MTYRCVCARACTWACCWACVLLFAECVAVAQTKDKRLPVPDSAAQKQAVERIKSIFPKEYASPNKAVKVGLGQELLKLAQAEKDPTARFALYREAVQIASTAGDVATTFTAIDDMRSGYQINEPLVRSFALESLAKIVQSKEDCITVAEACEGVAGMLIADNRFNEAKKLLGSGFNVARKIRGTDHATRLRETAESIDETAARFTSVAASIEKLKSSPNDAAANLEVGKYECFDKGNWEKGLAYLAKGSDAALKKVAEQTLAKPDEAEAQYAVAEGWWKAAEVLKGASQSRTRGYASHWYQEALPNLTGLSKAMAQKRIDEFKPSAGSAAARGPRTINLIDQLEPDEDFKPKDKWRLDKGVLQCTQMHFVPKVVFPYQPPAEYDVKITFAQAEPRNGVGILMPNPNGNVSFAFKVGANRGTEIMLSDEQRRYRRDVQNLIRPGVKYAIVFKVRKAGVQATMNGVGVLDLRTDFSDLKVDDWTKIEDWQNLAIFCDDPTVFYQVEVTEISGEGAMTRFPKEEE
jgi:hypothetical protein